MDLGIEGKRAAVAAASGGLGLAAAVALTAEGARVAICGRDAGRIEESAARVGGGCVPLVGDVTGVAGGRDFVRKAADALGGLDILVANNGGPPAGNVGTTELADYQAALEMNLLSIVGMCHEAVPAMRDAGWGRIVAITSLSVRQPMAALVLSNVARSGATAFLKTLAREVAPHGITVNTVQPGLHDTDRLRSLYGGDSAAAGRDIPAGVVGSPADFGAVVTFLCSQPARFCTGVALNVDGGAYTGLQ